MIIGLLKEIKDNEYRVAVTPENAKKIVKAGHELLVEHNAGAGSGYHDSDFENAGAKIVKSAKQICERAGMIVKVKEPLESEYNYFHKGHQQMVFAFFHFASNQQLFFAMQAAKINCIAFETVQKNNGSLPLLAPMSEVAGKAAAIVAANLLAKPLGGKGVLASSVAGAKPAKFLVIGGGIVGKNATLVAKQLGAEVTLLEINPKKRKQLAKELNGVKILDSNRKNIEALVPKTDVLIGAVLVPGARAPIVVSRALVEKMSQGSVIVDVAIDQGGCIETSKPTTHSNPTFSVNGVLHYCVTNIPGAFPRTSSTALSNATLPYLLELAKNGLKTKNAALRKGFNLAEGKTTNKTLAQQFKQEFFEF